MGHGFESHRDHHQGLSVVTESPFSLIKRYFGVFQLALLASEKGQVKNGAIFLIRCSKLASTDLRVRFKHSFLLQML